MLPFGGLLGLPELPRPDFGFPGAWYSLGGDLQLHIIVNEGWSFPPVEHDRFEIHARLSQSGYPFHDYYSGPTGFRRLFVHDPDGNMVEFIGPSRLAGPARLAAPAGQAGPARFEPSP